MNPAMVLVLVGTDRHRFDRLMGWLESWYASRQDPPEVLVQHGHSRPPALPGATPFLRHGDLHAALAVATAVVCHGGPATIAEARRAGHLPVVVPRDPSFGEHVDDHQLRFARRLAGDRLVQLCESQAALAAALDTTLDTTLDAPPTAGHGTPDGDEAAGGHGPGGNRAAPVEAAARVGAIVETLIATRLPRRRGAAGGGAR